MMMAMCPFMLIRTGFSLWHFAHNQNVHYQLMTLHNRLSVLRIQVWLTLPVLGKGKENHRSGKEMRANVNEIVEMLMLIVMEM